MRRTLLVLVALSLVAAACGAGDSDTASSLSTVPSATVPESSEEDGGVDLVLLAGSIDIPAAGAFGDPGFHQPYVLTGIVPEAAVGLSGVLVVRLRDVGRPSQKCDRNHPLSGCATVDWSDFEDRPGVPEGGVFDNRLNVISGRGPVGLFLSESGTLATTPDAYSPT